MNYPFAFPGHLETRNQIGVVGRQPLIRKGIYNGSNVK